MPKGDRVGQKMKLCCREAAGWCRKAQIVGIRGLVMQLELFHALVIYLYGLLKLSNKKKRN